MFYFEKIENKKVLKSTLLEGLEHFFTTKESVIRSQEVGALDLVNENKKIICNYFNITENNFISPIQTHSSNIDIVREKQSSYPNTDGLILTNMEQAVYLNFADCTPLIFYDSKQNIAAVSHAGWRGTAGMIAVKTVEKMAHEFKTNLTDIKCAIGPAISLCCYNVGEDVYRQLLDTVKQSDALYEIKNNEIFVDLKNINKRQLIEYGLLDENIDVCDYCTVCDNDLFFSYRKENATTGRHSAVVKLN